MRIQVVNPNTSGPMTEAIGRAARAVAAPGTIVETVASSDGPASIEGYYDGAFAVPGLVAAILAAERAGADAAVIACFDDTGLHAARAAARIPVVGLCEAALRTAAFLATRISVVTTLPRSIAPISENVAAYGMSARVTVRASGLEVLALEGVPPAALATLSAEIERAIAADGADAIVLGCAGMAEIAAALTERFGLPVIDGVAAAVKQAEALVGLGLATSKAGAYAPPLRKGFTGGLAATFAMAYD